MRLQVDYETRYTYEAPVAYGLQQCRLRPKDSRGQKVIDWNVTIEGGQSELRYEDHNNNVVELIGIEPGRTEVAIRCVGLIENTASDGVVGPHSGLLPLWHFRSPTSLTRVGSNIRRLIEHIDASDIGDVSVGHRISEAVLEAVEYENGVTGPQTTAEEAVDGRKGVCQDHTHIFCAAARQLGIPARYVSGYLMMNDRIEQEASHAWAEAFFEGIGWVGFDVSNGYSPDERYVRVATGLDYREASPVSGMRMGGTGEGVLVSLRVEQ